MANERTLRARIRLIDNYTAPMRAVVAQTTIYQKIASKIKPLIIKAKDMASRIIAPIKAKIDAIKAIPQVQTVLKAVDMASKVASKVYGGLKKIGGMVISATVKVLDKASSILSGIGGKLSALAGGVTIGVALKTGVQGMMAEETQRITIDRVLQNSGVDKGQSGAMTDDYYKYLEGFANKTPFETSSLTDWGTKAMMISKGNMDQAKKMTEQMANTKAFVGDMRTEYEVGQAFFSASQGEMATLNSMLGTNYETLEEAMKGIDQNQSGLVDSMSTTVGGLWSTVTGKMKVGAKKFMQSFQEPMKNALNMIAGEGGMLDTASTKFIEFGGRLANIDFSGLFASFDFSLVLTALQPVVDLFNSFFTGIETKSPVTMGIMQILGTVFNTVWTAIGAVINAVKPIVEKIFVFIGEHGQEISAIIDALGVVWDAVWKTVGTLLEGAWVIVEPILDGLFKGLEEVADMVKNVGQWWKDMVDKIKNNPITEAAGNAWNTVTSWFGGRRAYGANRVPRNDTPYRLHEGEMVLTRTEADRYRNGGNGSGVNISVSSLVVREEADIDKVANKLVRKIKEAQLGYSGVMG